MAVPLTRRRFVQAAAGAGGLLIGSPAGVLAQSLGGGDGTDAYGTVRASRLVPGEWVVHADMHNHTLFSDGDGDAAEAFASMRDAGLDVAALTDHATISQGLPDSVCGVFEPVGLHTDCQGLAGLHEGSWQQSAALADGGNVDGAFTAIRGFEWSSPTLGHVNVWFSNDWIDPLHTGGIGSPEDLALFAAQNGLAPAQVVYDALAPIVAATPAAGAGMQGLYAWLKADPSTPIVGGGADAIMGFNHPGREPLRFSEFTHDPALVDRFVSLELFNRRDDYLFELTDSGARSPLVACLDAGWKPGLLGVTDEHGTDWGYPDGKGRAGLYVTELSREGVREAMEQRRFFATNLKGLRLDATANGARMGTTFGHATGTITFAVDVDRGASWIGRRLTIQVLATGAQLPTIVHSEPVTVPGPSEPVISFTITHDEADGRWLVLRVVDDESSEAPDGRAAGTGFEGLVAVAYASPFHLDPDMAPPSPVPEPTGTPAPQPLPNASAPPSPLPATGGGMVAAGALAAVAAMRLRGQHRHV